VEHPRTILASGRNVRRDRPGSVPDNAAGIVVTVAGIITAAAILASAPDRHQSAALALDLPDFVRIGRRTTTSAGVRHRR
jgi:hypothetical protein